MNISVFNGSATLEAGGGYTRDPSDDAVWILTSTFIIFTMQSGFGLLESGSVTSKNEVNIMVKNAVDVIVGGCSYWAFGYAFSFGQDPWSNPFCGWGNFFAITDQSRIGEVYSQFFFQASFATTATTIVSGAMAERTKLEAYIIFSALNTLVFCFPAHWMWADNGWLKTMGVIDVAGDGPVHLVGGITGLVATLMLKPRHGRYSHKKPPPMGSPTNALLGMFMLWWGWLGFNCGSTFGISGPKWKLAARSAVATLCASVGGGMVGLLLSYIFKKRKFDVAYMINGILASLVAITGMCALAEPWEGVVIGAIGAVLALLAIESLDRVKVDDPVGCVGVHAVGGAWGLVAIGLFARPDPLRSAISIQTEELGVLWGGSAYLLGVQLMATVVIAVWTAIMSFLLLKVIDLTVGLRMSLQHEILGADLVEHAVGDVEYDKSTNSVIISDSRNANNEANGTGRDPKPLPSFNETRKKRQKTIISNGIRRANYLRKESESTGGRRGMYTRCAKCAQTETGDEGEGVLCSTESDVYGSFQLRPSQWCYECDERSSNTLVNSRGRQRVSPLSPFRNYFRRAKSLSFRNKTQSNIKRRNTIAHRERRLTEGRWENPIDLSLSERHFHINRTFSPEGEDTSNSIHGEHCNVERIGNGFHDIPQNCISDIQEERNVNSLDIPGNDIMTVYM